MKNDHSKKKNSRGSLIFSAVVLVLFLGVLAGIALWERGQSADPAQTQPVLTMSVQSTQPDRTEPTEAPTTVPPETTLPDYEARRINFLLVGRDAHAEGENGRSDSMMLCSVDTGTNTVTLISFLRDMYVPIPGYRDNRLNAAYSMGGSELLIKTLEQNFDIHVDVSLEIDFEGFASMIDLLGGVDIDLTADEAGYMNSAHGWSLTEGINHLDGAQALSYSRIRYLDSDFGRTERQRNVLTALLQKYRHASWQQVLNATDAFLDQSTSDHSDEELLAYALELYTSLADARLVTHRVPADGTWTYEKIRGMSVIGVDFEENCRILEELLNPEEVR